MGHIDRAPRGLTVSRIYSEGEKYFFETVFTHQLILLTPWQILQAANIQSVTSFPWQGGSDGYAGKTDAPPRLMGFLKINCK